MKANEPSKPKISVVVPCYKSAATLPQLLRRIEASLGSMGLTFEVVFVEDCGGDETWQCIQSLRASNSAVKGIRLARNFGQHNALLAGIRAANGEWVVTIDDDLQNPPEEIWKLYEKALQNFDVVYGKPRQQQHGMLRNFASTITKLVLKDAMGSDIATNLSAFRVFRTKLRDAFASYHGPVVNIDVLLTWGTKSYASVVVEQDERQVGVSGYNFRKLLAHATNMMTGFSVLPLQLASVMGFFFAAAGFLILISVVVRFMIYGSPVPGFPFLASIVSVFAGIQLFALGIIGEYLARIHLRSMNKPAFVIAEE